MVVPQVVPGRVEAESFVDFVGIRLEECSDPASAGPNDQNVGWIDDGDLMEYRVDVATTGTYHLDLRVASADPAAGSLQMVDGNGQTMATVDIPPTGGWQTWETVSLPLSLSTGEQTIRLVAVTGGFNLNWFELSTIPLGFSVQVEAEDFTSMLGVQTEATSDLGGGQNVGWLDTGDWMSYSLSLPANGTYTIEYRVASAASTGQLVLSQNATDIVVTDIPNTGGWQNWTTVSATVDLVNTSNDTYVLYVNNGPFNINWFSLSYQAPDYEAPTPVSNLTAAATATSVQLSWDPASDNVGVTGYEVFVDGVLAAFTSNLNYEVTGLDPSTMYQFEVYALDGAGNQSVASGITATTASMIYFIEAESYTSMWGVGVENTTDVNGGQNVGWIDNGDWMSYEITVPVTGTYEIQYRIASPNSTGQLIFSQNAADLQTTSIPNTGWWQNWQTITTTVDLMAGEQTYALYASNGGFNINWWSYELINAGSGSASRNASNAAQRDLPMTPLADDEKFLIYPNPAADRLDIQLTGFGPDVVVTILDLAGRVQLQRNSLAEYIQLNVSHLKPGIYFIKVAEQGRTEVRKLVKE